MGGNQRNKQKRLEKKRAQFKSTQKRQSHGSGGSGQSGFSSFRRLLTVPKAPIHECWMSTTIFENGMGHVVISRRLVNGDIAFGVFLLDVYCLGVKDCFLSIKSESEYDDFRRLNQDKYIIQTIHQTCARKIIEGAVDYANNLGFKPHADFKRDKLILGDIDHTLCPTSFEYGKDGKPFYISGPNDSLERQQQIIKQLQKLQAGGYNFMAGNLDFDELFENGIVHSFKIIDGPMPDLNPSYTEDIRRKLGDLYTLTMQEPGRAVPILEQAIEENPDVPQFYNYLCSAYALLRNKKKMDEVIVVLYKKKPEYLFARINYANYCLRNGRLDKIPEIFGNTYHLQGLYPGRDEFHVTEVIGFYGLMGRFLLEKGERKNAEAHLKMLSDIDPNHQETKVLGTMLFLQRGIFRKNFG